MSALSLLRYKLSFTVPPASLEKCKSALFAAGAGTFPGGKYTHVAFETKGIEQFMPQNGAHPSEGEVGKLERLEEVKCEVLCVGEETMRQAVEDLVRVHPYEEVAYEVYKMEDV